MKLPHGWTEQYAIGWLLEQQAQQIKAIEALISRVADLESEIARLDVEKASRAGRKSKATVGRRAATP